MRLAVLRRNDQGSAAVEMAFILPVVLILIYGFFQVGAVFAANAMMQRAIGEGARYATIWPAHTDVQIKARVEARLIQIYKGNFVVADPVTTTVAASAAVDAKAAVGTTPAVVARPAVAAVKKTVLTITYTYTPDLIIYTPPAITLTRTKTAYMPVELAT